MVILDTWHIVRGKWTHIVQIKEASGIQYFTDGEREQISPK